jgi:single-strand DNA-binding protein
MAGETTITVIGNLTNDPELRFTPSGSAVANFTIASTPRTFDRQSNEWKDGETLFLRAAVWREAAENVAESLTKGMRVIVTGRLKSRSYETKEGEKRTVIELEVDEIGPSLRYANAKVNRTQRSGGQGGQGGFGGGNSGGGFGGGNSGGNQGGNSGGGWGGGNQQAAQDDPWATPGVSNAGRRRTTTIPWINIHGLPRLGAPRWLRLNSVSPNQSPTP